MNPKLPSDPSGNVVPISPVGSSVKKSIVLRVLRNNGVSVTEEADGVILSKGEISEVEYFPALLNRRMLHTLSRKFGVPIHHFYHPESSSSKR